MTLELLATGRIEIIRDSEEEHLVNLLVTDDNGDDSSCQYWVFDKTFEVPNNIIEEKREGVGQRKVSVAFPIDDNGSSGQMFAYLPTEVDSGFPFLANADFVLSSSRETIQIDKPWNRWLRDVARRKSLE